MNYGRAIEALKNGKLVTRKGWNGKGMFIFMRPGDDLPVSILPGVKSLPVAVKEYFIVNKFGDETEYASGKPITIRFTPYLCMKSANDEIVNGWLASQTDMLAEDWEEFVVE